MFSEEKDRQTLPGKYRLFVTVLFFVPLNAVLILFLANLIGYQTVFGINTKYFELNPLQYGFPHIIAMTVGAIFVFNSLYFFLTIRSSVTLVFLIDSAVYCLYAFIMWAIKGPNIFYLSGLVVLPIISLFILYFRNKKRFEKASLIKEEDVDGEKDEEDEKNDSEYVEED